MPKNNIVHFFLGANTAGGFCSLYDKLLPPEEARRIYILKGGPGCGKSSLIHRVGETLAGRGEETEYIHCSGDPDSLDAVYFPKRKTAILDGTAPHVMEPSFPGVVERYVDLSCCYDMEALQAVRGQIISGIKACRECYTRAYRCLKAQEEMHADLRNLLATPAVRAKIARRAQGILKREIKRKKEGNGKTSLRFLGGVTCKGMVCRNDTIASLCERIYELSDSFGLAGFLLKQLADGAVQAGYDVIACPAPLQPERLEHLLIPSLSLGFVTGGAARCKGKPYRRIRFDAMPEPGMLRTCRARLRFARRVCDLLREEAVTSLAEAKTIHDSTEALYNPHVDFGRVYQTADEIISEIEAGR